MTMRAMGEAPPRDTVDLYVEMHEKDVYSVETILKGYDGVAHIRRDWFRRDGRLFFRVMVPPGLENLVREVLESMRGSIWIGKIRTEI
jgi:hypothetical protein